MVPIPRISTFIQVVDHALPRVELKENDELLALQSSVRSVRADQKKISRGEGHVAMILRFEPEIPIMDHQKLPLLVNFEQDVSLSESPWYAKAIHVARSCRLDHILMSRLDQELLEASPAAVRG